MYSRIQRPLSAEEQSRIRDAVPQPMSSWQWFFQWHARGVVVSAIIWFLLWWMHNWMVATIAVLAYLFVENVLIGSLKASLEDLRFLRTEWGNRNRLLALIANAEPITVETMNSNRVIAIYGDDGEFYVYEVANNQLYWSTVTQSKSQWPNSSFEIVQVPGFNDVLPPTCHGSKLKPLAEIDIRDLDGFSIPNDNPSAGSLEALFNEAKAHRG